MKQLEIVHLRSSGVPIEDLSDRIKASIGLSNESGTVVRLYRRSGLATDLAVHILSPDAMGKQSDVAQQLASALRSHGLVEHTVWEPLK